MTQRCERMQGTDFKVCDAKLKQDCPAIGSACTSALSFKNRNMQELVL